MHTIPPNVHRSNVMYVPHQSTHAQYNVSIVAAYMVHYYSKYLTDELALNWVYWRYCSLLCQLLYFLLYRNPMDRSPVRWTLSELSIP